MKSVDFYFDYGSPASHLAWTQLPRICAQHGATLNYRPIVLGAVFKATGNASPAMVPAKGRYVMQDLLRWARHWDVPFQLNPHFPIDTVTLMKTGFGVQLLQPERFDAFNRAVFTALWVDGLNLNQPDIVAGTMKAAGFDMQQLMQIASDTAVREGIRRNTDEAVRRGVFGAPTFFVGDQMLWGQDRLFMLEQWLGAKP